MAAKISYGFPKVFENHPVTVSASPRPLCTVLLWNSICVRYLILARPCSLVKLGAVQFPGNTKLTSGLYSKQNISACVEILETCSSMCLDDCRWGNSIIMSTSTQIGPPRERIILGPLRFANHDCNPNCQVTFLSFHPLARCIHRPPVAGYPQLARVCYLYSPAHQNRRRDHGELRLGLFPRSLQM